MKIFITGATGYIGGSVAAGLISAGHEVLGLVRYGRSTVPHRSLVTSHGVSGPMADKEAGLL